MYAKQMFEAGKAMGTEMLGLLKKGKAIQTSGAYVVKSKIYVNKTERSWDIVEIELQESFKLKTGSKRGVEEHSLVEALKSL